MRCLDFCGFAVGLIPVFQGLLSFWGFCWLNSSISGFVEVLGTLWNLVAVGLTWSFPDSSKYWAFVVLQVAQFRHFVVLGYCLNINL